MAWILRKHGGNEIHITTIHLRTTPYFFPFKLTDSLVRLAASFFVSVSAPIKLVSQVGLAVRAFFLSSSSFLKMAALGLMVQSVTGATWSLPFQSMRLSPAGMPSR